MKNLIAIDQLVSHKTFTLPDELLWLAGETETRMEQACSKFLHERLDDAIINKSNFLRELSSLGLLPRPISELHDFFPDKLNEYFAGVSYSPTENLPERTNVINNATNDGFYFTDITLII